MIDCCLEFVCACLLHDINLGPTLPAGGMSAFFVFAFASQRNLHRMLWQKGPRHQNIHPSCPRGLATCHRLRLLTRNEALLRNWVARNHSEQEQGHAPLKETEGALSQKSQNLACADPVHESGRFSCLPKTHGHLFYGGFGNGLLRSNDSLKVCQWTGLTRSPD